MPEFQDYPTLIESTSPGKSRSQIDESQRTSSPKKNATAVSIESNPTRDLNENVSMEDLRRQISASRRNLDSVPYRKILARTKSCANPQRPGVVQASDETPLPPWYSFHTASPKKLLQLRKKIAEDTEISQREKKWLVQEKQGKIFCSNPGFLKPELKDNWFLDRLKLSKRSYAKFQDLPDDGRRVYKAHIASGIDLLLPDKNTPEPKYTDQEIVRQKNMAKVREKKELPMLHFWNAKKKYEKKLSLVRCKMRKLDKEVNLIKKLRQEGEENDNWDEIEDRLIRNRNLALGNTNLNSKLKSSQSNSEPDAIDILRDGGVLGIISDDEQNLDKNLNQTSGQKLNTLNKTNLSNDDDINSDFCEDDVTDISLDRLKLVEGKYDMLLKETQTVMDRCPTPPKPSLNIIDDNNFRCYWNSVPKLLHSEFVRSEEKIQLSKSGYVRKQIKRNGALAAKEEEKRLMQEKKNKKSLNKSRATTDLSNV